jgi:predicted phosphoribosyltransferase
MAFQMDPLPETIIFMTDGVAAGDPIGVAKAIARKAKKNKITINTVALMEPKAAEAMAKLAEGSGGKFVLIGADGKKRKGQGK